MSTSSSRIMTTFEGKSLMTSQKLPYLRHLQIILWCNTEASLPLPAYHFDINYNTCSWLTLYSIDNIVLLPLATNRRNLTINIYLLGIGVNIMNRTGMWLSAAVVYDNSPFLCTGSQSQSLIALAATRLTRYYSDTMYNYAFYLHDGTPRSRG